MEELLSKLKFDEKGLIPVVTQDAKTGAVLMLAYMNREAVERTISTGQGTYFSRSRQCLWVKGETSGHRQKLVSLTLDCDGDALLMKVEQTGPACHTGEYTCFHQPIVQGASLHGANTLNEDYATILDRVANPRPGSYTNYLFEKGIDKMCKKIGEEATEVVIAAKNGDPEEITYEAADLVYHLLVIMAQQGVKPEDLYAELESRRG